MRHSLRRIAQVGLFGLSAYVGWILIGMFRSAGPNEPPHAHAIARRFVLRIDERLESAYRDLFEISGNSGIDNERVIPSTLEFTESGVFYWSKPVYWDDDQGAVLELPESFHFLAHGRGRYVILRPDVLICKFDTVALDPVVSDSTRAKCSILRLVGDGLDRIESDITHHYDEDQRR